MTGSVWIPAFRHKRHAADRGVTIVPEIEMPGHTGALLRSCTDLLCQGNDQIKLANLATGDYVAKQKFLTTQTKNKALQSQVTDLQTELSELETFRTRAENVEKHLKIVAIDNALLQSGVKNVQAVRALLDQNQIQLENDTLIGIDHQLDQLKTTEAYLFTQPTPPHTHPANPAGKTPLIDYASVTDEELFQTRMQGK